MKRKLFLLQLLLLAIITLHAQQPNNREALRTEIADYLKGKNIKVGIAVKNIEKNDTFSIEGNTRFPLMSVVKAHLACAVLHLTDKQKFNLGTKFQIDTTELDTETWSPMLKDFKRGVISLTLDELLKYSVSKSDNNACDKLFRICGGPAKVNDYMRMNGLKDLSIQVTEYDMHKDIKNIYKNYSTPLSAVSLLEKIQMRKMLTPEKTDYLLRIMTESENSSKRIKGTLPQDVIVAHKTGSCAADPSKNIEACNDIGIITMPDKTHLIIAFFTSDSKLTYDETELLIAEITQMIYTSFQN